MSLNLIFFSSTFLYYLAIIEAQTYGYPNYYENYGYPQQYYGYPQHPYEPFTNNNKSSAKQQQNPSNKAINQTIFIYVYCSRSVSIFQVLTSAGMANLWHACQKWHARRLYMAHSDLAVVEFCHDQLVDIYVQHNCNASAISSWIHNKLKEFDLSTEEKDELKTKSMPNVVCQNIYGRMVCAGLPTHPIQPYESYAESDCDTESEEPITEKTNTVNLELKRTVETNCGLGLTTQTPLVHYGRPISPGHFPWIVALHYKRSRGGHFLCGGSLVSTRTVISAAHCFQGVTKYDVELSIGRHNLNDNSEHFKLRNIKRLIIHPEYNSISMPDADLAIMHLSKPVRFNERIKPICLWNGSTDLDEIVDKKGFVAGWGANEHQQLSTVPKMVSADIVSESTCRRHWHNVSPRSLCASNLDGTGPCSGDSGSALMLKRDERWFLRGVVSVGSIPDGQCNQNTYVLYCDVAKHMRWVQRNVIY